MNRTVVRLLARLACSLAVLALALPVGAQASDPVVTYRVDLRQPQTQMVAITVTVPTVGVEEETFSLPVWRPGRYNVLNPAGTVRGVRAWSESGEELRIRKTDKSSWGVKTDGAAEVTVSYSLYANSLGDRTRHVDDTHAFLSGSAVFFYAPRLRHAPVRVEVDAPAGWDIASGLEHAPGRDDVVVAANYDVLVDSPLEIGDHDRIEFTVLDKPHEIVIWPSGTDHDADQMVEDFSKIIVEQHAIFGELPYERYVFLIHAGKGAGGGTEHLNSTIMQTSLASMEGSKDGGSSYKRFLGLVSHEFFHTWNVKQFRPDGIHPYDYQNENCTDLLWVCEGSTSYYTSLSLVRCELSKVDSYVNRIGSAGDSLRKNPAARVQSVAEASWDSWVAKSDPDSRNRTVDFYGKGSQVSLCIDLELRRRTDNAASYDDVMKALYQRFPLDGPGYTSDDLMTILQEMSGSSWTEFFDAYVFGTEELPFEEVLPTVGLTFVFDPNDAPEEDDASDESDSDEGEASEATTEDDVAKEEPAEPAPVPLRAYLGLRLSGGGSGSTVSGFYRDGPAIASGLRLGDEVLTLNEERLRPSDLDDRLEGLAPGDVVRLHVLRDDKLRTFEIELGGVPDGTWKVERVADPTEAQIAAYESWIGHEWPGKEEDAEADEPSDPTPPEAAPPTAPAGAKTP